MSGKPRALSERDLETLDALEKATDFFLSENHRDGWCRPMDCGGTTGSHHGATLKRR